MTDVQLTVFLEFTRRYDEIAKHFAIEMREESSAFDKAYQEKRNSLSEDIRHALLRYFNLCSHEYFLSTQGFIDEEVWAVWTRDITAKLKRPLFHDAWAKARESYSSYPDFQAFMDKLLPSPKS